MAIIWHGRELSRMDAASTVARGMARTPGTGAWHTVVGDSHAIITGVMGSIGMCWRVQGGLCSPNTQHDHAGCGIPIGHKERANQVTGKEITWNLMEGILSYSERKRRAMRRRGPCSRPVSFATTAAPIWCAIRRTRGSSSALRALISDGGTCPLRPHALGGILESCGRRF